MSATHAGLVVSGRPYTVTEVAGRTPTSLEDFTGETVFVLTGDEEPHVIAGVGAVSGGSARFHQKDLEHHGKDVRVWSITAAPEGGFTARHDAAI